MSFAQETPLEDVIKYLKVATSRGPDGPGLPIYVDPVGLQEAEKTMQSPVVMELENVPIRTALRLMLRQLDLDYAVEDGILIISTAGELTHILARGPMFDPVYYKQRVKEQEVEERQMQQGGGGAGGRSVQ